MQMHAKEIEKSVEWKRSDMKSAKESVKMDVPSMFDVVCVGVIYLESKIMVINRRVW